MEQYIKRAISEAKKANKEIDDETKYLAVLGNPITHSLSPRLHNYWLKKHKINGIYLALNPENNFTEITKQLSESGFIGVNLTMPYKEVGLEICDEVEIEAKLIGAVNGLIFKEDKIFGFNSDVFGFTESLKNYQLNTKNTAMILGASGAARSAIIGLKKLGFKKIFLSNRTSEKAENLKMKFSDNIKIEIIDWQSRNEIQNEIQTDFIINTTSLGWKQNDDLGIRNFHRGAIYYDMVYRKSDFLIQAEKAGGKIIDGSIMFLYQAQKSFYNWFGITPETDDSCKKLFKENH